MYLFYVANNTNDYGIGIHKCLLVMNPTYITKSELEHKYDFVIFKDLRDSQNETKPNQLVIDNNNVRVKVENELVEDYKHGKILEIKEKYELARKSGYNCSFGFKVDCDENDMNNWDLALKRAELKNHTEVYIRDYDNTFRIMTIDDYRTMALETGDYVMSLMAKKGNLEDTAKFANTISEVESIVG